MKINKKIISLIILVSIFGLVLITSAQTPMIDKLTETGLGPAGGTTTRSLPVLIGDIVKVFLSILGIIFVILVLYGGFRYMLSQGDKTKTSEAIKMIVNAVIGLAIILLAYAITEFVLTGLVTATTQ